MADYAVKGTQLQIAIGSPTTYTQVGQLVSIDPPGYVVGKRDITTLSSTAKEYSVSIPDPQPIAFTLIYDRADQAAITLQTRSIVTVSTGDLFKVVASTTTVFWGPFNAKLTKWQPKGGDVEGTIMVEGELQPSGTMVMPTTA